MVAGFLQNLRLTDKIVDPDTGTPTLAFLRLLGITNSAAEGVTNNIIAGSGLSGGGSLDNGPVTLDAVATEILDQISSTRGSVLYRGSSAWLSLAPGASGRVLRTNGAGADPTWEEISALLDLIGSTRGMVLYRGASGWAALSPGTAGQVLTTGGAGADPSWAAGGGGGGGNNAIALATMRPLTDFTQLSISGNYTATDFTGKAILLQDTAPLTTFKLAGLSRAVPATPYRIFIFVQANLMRRNYLGPAWGFYDGTKYQVITIGDIADLTMELQQWTNSTTRSAFAATSNMSFDNAGGWLVLEDDGTKVGIGFSSDGVKSQTRKITKSGGFLANYNTAFVGLGNLGSGGLSGADNAWSMAIRTYDEAGLSRTYT